MAHSKLPKVNGKRIPGAVLYQGRGFDGRRVVVIATFRSANRKTGNMIQIWILRAHLNPVEVLMRGLDRAVCGTCPHASRASGGDGTCYVNVGQAPSSVWRSWRNGNYPEWDGSDEQLQAMFAGRAVRFGAYGDPALIPADLIGRITAIARASGKITSGYTHAWTTHPEHRAYLMASADGSRERDNARSHGWRVFTVRPTGAGPEGPHEISCPASDEAGKKTTCDKCGLCAGAGRPAADITIQAHGHSARRFGLATV